MITKNVLKHFSRARMIILRNSYTLRGITISDICHMTEGSVELF